MTRTVSLVPYHRTARLRAAALILPGGFTNSRGRYLPMVDIALRALARRLAEADSLAVYLVRYRYRGWNGAHADPLQDTYEALDQVHRRQGDVPVALIGNSLGGRAAFRAADSPAVASVVGIAPWLPDGEPVAQLANRKVLIMHGDRDRTDASAAKSLAYAHRARAVVPDLARFEIAGGGHLLLCRSADCWALTTAFVTATVGSRALDPAIAEAMHAQGLRTPLEVGFGRNGHP
jgi:hypothetical protein